MHRTTPTMKFKPLLALGSLIFGLLSHAQAQAPSHPAPFVRLADLQIDATRLTAFTQAATQHAEAALRSEPGLLALHAMVEKGKASHVRVLEIYTDAVAYRDHLRSPHFRQFRNATEPMTTHRALFDATPVLLGAKPRLPSTAVVRTADLEIDPARLEAYKAAVSEEIEASIRLEPGVFAIYAVALKDAPNQLRFVEIYADENAYQLHRETPHFKKYLEVTQPMITGRKLFEALPLVIAARPR